MAVLGGVLLLGTAALLFVAEWILGWGEPPAAPPPGTYRYIRLAEHRPSASARITPAGGFPTVEQKEYPLEIDEHGFIEPTAVHDDPDLTLAFLGGSTTECMLVDRELRFPHLVGRLLEEQGLGNTNAYNCGKAGAHSLNSLNTLINKLIPLQPDVVVMMHNVNDLIVLLYEGSYWNDNPYRGLIVERRTPTDTASGLLKRLGRTLFPNLIARLRPPSTEPVDPFASLRGQVLEIDEQRLRRDFTTSLEMFLSICRVNDIAPVLMTQPNRLVDEPDDLVREHAGKLERDFGVSYARYQALWELFNQTIRDAAQTHGVALVDLAAELPRDAAHMYDICHYNNRGSQRVASVIARELVAQSVVSSK